MKATTIYGARDVRLENQPDPTIQKPTDAVVKVVAACVCGSDLWYYRGDNPINDPFRIGHEFVGVVEEVGSQVRSLRKGDFVIAPFMYCDNTCQSCRVGIQSACSAGGVWGGPDRDGLMADCGQGEYVRVPLADGTLVATRESPDAAMIPSLLALSDVMGTGWHAAMAARVQEGDTVVVVGDGAVGLSGVLAASRMGAQRVVAMSRHQERQKIARSFGATNVIAERGAAGEAAVLELTCGLGADAVLECVGTSESMTTAITVARPGATVGYVGVPHRVEFPVRSMFSRNVGVAGGIAPVRQYLPALRDDVLAGVINPGLVFDLDLPLDKVAEGYAAMDERRSVKTMLRPCACRRRRQPGFDNLFARRAPSPSCPRWLGLIHGLVLVLAQQDVLTPVLLGLSSSVWWFSDRAPPLHVGLHLVGEQVSQDEPRVSQGDPHRCPRGEVSITVLATP